MVRPKSKNAVGLGNSLMNDRFGRGKGQDMRRGPKGVQRVGADGQAYITTPKEEAAWMKMRSITEQNDLDEFLNTAELAGTDFQAEKLNNVKVIHKDQQNPYLLSAAQERATQKKQKANRRNLKVPRRPQWDDTTTTVELDQLERENFLEWRRGLAEMEENQDLLMTPFERNLEVWRQLWRVIERSDLVVQIVDARNPLLFRCEDLENYVKDVDRRKNNLLLVNKADMMTLKQRQAWVEYFHDAGINFRFFSAELAKDINEARRQAEDSDSDSEDYDDESEEEDGYEDRGGEVDIVDETELAAEAERIRLREEAEDDEEWSSEEEIEETKEIDQSIEGESTRILTTDELEALFLAHAPEVDETTEDGQRRKTQIGLVGYPNVGKSSCINALIGAKKVSVSSTPGKTKHFQTIHLSDNIILCDCPGLVFPNFANTKAELVCNGILPIDQLREFTGPAALVAQRIPQAYLEAIYGMKIYTRPLEEGGTGFPTGEEILSAYAAARGFWTTGQGQPNESRAARYILKDYVKGKLLFCHPPPSDPPFDGREFNRDLYNTKNIPQKQRAQLALEEESIINESEDPSLMDDPDLVPLPRPEGKKTQALDKRFFGPPKGDAAHITRPFHQRADQGDSEAGKQLSGRKLKTMIALEKGIDPSEVKLNSKKHYKGNKRGKLRGEYV